jgi:hypothetical protein
VVPESVELSEGLSVENRLVTFFERDLPAMISAHGAVPVGPNKAITFLVPGLCEWRLELGDRLRLIRQSTPTLGGDLCIMGSESTLEDLISGRAPHEGDGFAMDGDRSLLEHLATLIQVPIPDLIRLRIDPKRGPKPIRKRKRR